VREPAWLRTVSPDPRRAAGWAASAYGGASAHRSAGVCRRDPGDRGRGDRSEAQPGGRHARCRLRLRARARRTQGDRDGDPRRGTVRCGRRRAVRQPARRRGVRARPRRRRGGRRLRRAHEAAARGDVRVRPRPGPCDPPACGGASMSLPAKLSALAGADQTGYSFAFLDEHTKRELRRRTLKAVAIPGHQVAFGSREMPLARGWGTGGIQLTLSLVGRHDVVKVIDQGDDASMNAVNVRALITKTTEVSTTYAAAQATLTQTRPRIPAGEIRPDAIIVLQVPFPEPLRLVEPSDAVTRRMHAERDYSKMWLYLYEDIARYGRISLS